MSGEASSRINPKQIQNSNDQNLEAPRFGTIWILNIRACFEFRASNFGFIHDSVFFPSPVDLLDIFLKDLPGGLNRLRLLRQLKGRLSIEIILVDGFIDGNGPAEFKLLPLGSLPGHRPEVPPGPD